MTLPVAVFFSRSLREGTRQTRTYVVRALLLLATFATLASAQASSSMRSAPGLTLFIGITGVNLVLICLAAPGYFASVITEEKEAGTLGLLKMAGLNPVSILLGKSTSQSLGAAMLLLVQVPFTVLAVTLGGITLAQVFAGYLTMLAFLLFVANVALLFSVLCQHSSRASTLCVLFFLAFFFGPPIGSVMVRAAALRWATLRGSPLLAALGQFFDYAHRASPFTRVGTIALTGFKGPLAGFQVWSDLALAAGFFLLAWAAFNRFTLEQVAEAPARGLLGRRSRTFSFLGPGRTWGNALAWKDFYFLAGGKVTLVGRTVLMGLVPGLMYFFGHLAHDRPPATIVGSSIVVVSIIVVFVELTVFSARLFGEERKWQTLSGVMVLPYSAWQVVARKTLGCCLGLQPYIVWFLVGAILMGDTFGDALGQVVSELGFWFSIACALCFFHLIVYVSLFLRRGVILLAFGIWLFGAYSFALVLSVAIFSGSKEAVLTLMLIGTVCVMLILQRMIARRLARAAELE